MTDVPTTLGEYRITTDPEALDLELVHRFLSQDAYWAKGRSLDEVRTSVEHSLCFGLFHAERQVGFARAVTDRATFAWICDVFVLEPHRRRGLGKWLIQAVMAHPYVAAAARAVLATRDAHELYQRYGGFTPLAHPERWMERKRSGSGPLAVAPAKRNTASGTAVGLTRMLRSCRTRGWDLLRSGKMPTRNLEELLETHKVKYAVIRHPPEYTAQEIAAAAHIPGRQLAKTVVAKIDGEVVMAVLPAHRRLDLDRLRKASGAKKAEMAAESDFKVLFPDCELGAVPPFGNLYAMRVFVDVSLASEPEISVSGGSHTERLRLPYADFERIVRPAVAELSAGV